MKEVSTVEKKRRRRKNSLAVLLAAIGVAALTLGVGMLLISPAGFHAETRFEYRPPNFPDAMTGQKGITEGIKGENAVASLLGVLRIRHNLPKDDGELTKQGVAMRAEMLAKLANDMKVTVEDQKDGSYLVSLVYLNESRDQVEKVSNSGALYFIRGEQGRLERFRIARIGELHERMAMLEKAVRGRAAPNRLENQKQLAEAQKDLEAIEKQRRATRDLDTAKFLAYPKPSPATLWRCPPLLIVVAVAVGVAVGLLLSWRTRVNAAVQGQTPETQGSPEGEEA